MPAACPICKAAIPEGRPNDEAFRKRVAEARIACSCGESVPVLEAEEHSCEHTKKRKLPQDSLPPSLPKAPAPAPNRSTFTCPLCGERNLSTAGLIEHCDKEHASQRGPVSAVCPVCLSMPWGDPNYISRDFLSHLRLRHHGCKYEEICDFEADEETMLRRAMEESMRSAGVADKDQEALLAQVLAESAWEAQEAQGACSESEGEDAVEASDVEESNRVAENKSNAASENPVVEDNSTSEQPSLESNNDMSLSKSVSLEGNSTVEA